MVRTFKLTYSYHLGFDPDDNVYKILRVLNWNKNVKELGCFDTQIFTLGVDSGWRVIDASPSDCHGKSICVGCKFYWLPGYDKLYCVSEYDTDVSSLICFDLKTEIFSTVHKFPDSLEVNEESVMIVRALGCIGERVALHVRDFENSTIWMPDSNVESEWTKVHENLPDECYGETNDTLPNGDMIVCVMSKYPKELFKLDGIDFKQIPITGLPIYDEFSDAWESAVLFYHQENILALAPLLNNEEKPALARGRDIRSIEAGSCSSKVKIILIPGDEGKKFLMDEDVGMQSGLIKKIIEGDCQDEHGCINCFLESATSDTLSKIVIYCKMHVKSTNEADLASFDTNFVDLDHNTILELMVAANYLDIRSLMDLTCKAMADTIKDKSLDEVRELFGIENNFTPEEQEKINNETNWAFEDY